MTSTARKKAKALFIVSPVPMVHLKNFIVNWMDLPMLGLADDLRDEWDHDSNTTERNRLLDLVFNFSHKNRIPVVFLSGDVHIGAAFKLMRKGKENAKVYQLTSSGITYCKAPGKLLKLAVARKGEFKGIPATKRTSFRMLHVYEENNFGIVSHKENPDGTTQLSWDLFGNSGTEEEVVRLRRIKLE